MLSSKVMVVMVVVVVGGCGDGGDDDDDDRVTASDIFLREFPSRFSRDSVE